MRPQKDRPRLFWRCRVPDLAPARGPALGFAFTLSALILGPTQPRAEDSARAAEPVTIDSPALAVRISPAPETTGALPNPSAAEVGTLAGGDPFAGIYLGGGLIEFLLTGEIAPRRRAGTLPPPVAPSGRDPGAAPVTVPAPRMVVVPYDGDLPPGTVIVNETRREVYRILPGRRAECHSAGEAFLDLAKSLTDKSRSGQSSPDTPKAGIASRGRVSSGSEPRRQSQERRRGSV
ncbi:hypothetical protein [Methylobacterium soli]|uniref:Uncharacterized protein n=1 Tax=Methylobacterium soli TaxID=553447 RepID=A0A6L3T2D7_9HYPH|nr:hypothetical protein [Methylobacterium soli]KAB1079286.1 hypothetical protein F6X53_10725 [Methylobacterium soli]GJE45207.1 hypothetical protein AEGHOMDF_4401 [Methylobacterium soli]